MSDNSPDAPAQAMTRERLSAEAPELLQALLDEGRASAGSEGIDYALTAMEAVCGKEKAQSVRTFITQAQALGLTSLQLAGLGSLMPQAPAAPQGAAQAGKPQDSRAAILNALQEQGAQTLPASPGAAATTGKSRLVADAERRRAQAKGENA